MRPCIRPSATTSQRSQRRSAAATSRCSNRRLPAATATVNSSSVRGVVERLTIDHVGHRGDGVSETGTAFVPYTLAGEVVIAEPLEGHAERRRLLRIVTASAERIDAFCPHFTVC